MADNASLSMVTIFTAKQKSWRTLIYQWRRGKDRYESFVCYEYSGSL